MWPRAVRQRRGHKRGASKLDEMSQRLWCRKPAGRQGMQSSSGSRLNWKCVRLHKGAAKGFVYGTLRRCLPTRSDSEAHVLQVFKILI